MRRHGLDGLLRRLFACERHTPDRTPKDRDRTAYKTDEMSTGLPWGDEDVLDL